MIGPPSDEPISRSPPPFKADASDRKRRPNSSPSSPSHPPPRTASPPRASKRTKKTKEEVRASHLLIKHEGSRRKASWKDPDGGIICATTRDAAVKRLRELREKIVSGKARFSDVAAKHSDCSSAKRGGDLGRFGRGKMQKPFEEAAFALQVGEIGDVVDTDSGVHIILRTD